MERQNDVPDSVAKSCSASRNDDNVSKEDFVECLNAAVNDKKASSDSVPSKRTQAITTNTRKFRQRKISIESKKSASGAPLIRAAFIHALTARIDDFRSAEVHRTALQARFYDLWCCKDGADLNCTEPMWSIAKRSRTMALTLDTLVLVNCGAATNNKQLLGEARSMYSLALASLRSELASPTPEGGYFNSLLGVHMLQVCELFDFLSSGRDSWRRHVSGMHAIMANTKAEERCASAEQAGWVLAKIIRVPFGLWNGLVREKGQAPIKKFTASSIRTLRKDNPDNSLLYYGRVPSVLQRGDAIIFQGHRADAVAVAEVLEDLVATEGALHKNLAKAYSEFGQGTYYTAQAATFPESTIPYNAGQSTFSSVNVFPNLLTALEHIYYWMCLLSLRKTHLCIRSAASKRAYPYEYDYCGFDEETLVRNAYECADNMCMSLPYMCLPERGYIGMICAIAPLQLASQWYKQQHDWSKLKWCREAGFAIKQRGIAEFDLG